MSGLLVGLEKNHFEKKGSCGMAISKMVQVRLSAFQKVLASYNTNRTSIAKGVVSALQNNSATGVQLSESDVFKILDSVIQRYQLAATNLQNADEEHNRELGEDSVARKQFHDATDNAYSGIIQLKDAIRSIYGDDTLQQLQIQGRTPTDAQTLGQLLQMLKSRFSDTNFTLPAKNNPYVQSLDKKQIVTQLDTILSALTKARTAYEKDLRETEGTLVAKNNQLQVFDKTEKETLGILLSMMNMAGMSEEADRVSPKRRKSRGSTSNSDENSVSEEESTENSSNEAE